MRTSRLGDVRRRRCMLVAGPPRSAARSALALATVLVACLASATAAGASTQAPTFARADYPQIGGHFVAADFNGDGRLDLAGGAVKAVAVLLNNGSGGFAARAEFPVADFQQDLAAGDFNGDGNVDIAVTINNPQIGVSLLAGNGDGTFDPAVNLPNTAGADSPAIVATDLDGDAQLDSADAAEPATHVTALVEARDGAEEDAGGARRDGGTSRPRWPSERMMSPISQTLVPGRRRPAMELDRAEARIGVSE
jgi:FG-GAP-like repeat